MAMVFMCTQGRFRKTCMHAAPNHGGTFHCESCLISKRSMSTALNVTTLQQRVDYELRFFFADRG